MKKHLFLLLSWTMLLLGAFSFASCGDDDDDDDNKKSESSAEPFVHKYRSQNGVYIDGDYIIDVMPTMILTYHFSNDTKMDEVKEYVYQFSHAIAEQAFEQMKDAGFKVKEINTLNGDNFQPAKQIIAKDGYKYSDTNIDEENLLGLVFVDGQLVNTDTFIDIRNRLHGGNN